jgi:hypothetical protein
MFVTDLHEFTVQGLYVEGRSACRDGEGCEDISIDRLGFQLFAGGDAKKPL